MSHEFGEDCPCCEYESIIVAGEIYCANGCELSWHPHGALVEAEDGDYPRPCPHVEG